MKRFFLLAALAFLLLSQSGCYSAPRSTKTAPPQTVEVLLSPVLIERYQDNLLSCFQGFDGYIPLIKSTISPHPDLNQGPALLWWGDPSGYHQLLETSRTAIPLGSESVFVILNSENGVQSLSQPELEDIFSGRLTSWENVPETGLSDSLALYLYPENHPVQHILRRTLFPDSIPSGRAWVVPHGPQLLETVSQDPSGIGFHFSSPDKSGVKVAEVQSDNEAWTHPILFILPQKPQEIHTELLTCLQGSDPH